LECGELRVLFANPLEHRLTLELARLARRRDDASENAGEHDSEGDRRHHVTGEPRTISHAATKQSAMKAAAARTVFMRFPSPRLGGIR
jgi:hypothetical protein